eukprot:scaffold422985_cov54-Attheya_sp.AAC.1
MTTRTAIIHTSCRIAITAGGGTGRSRGGGVRCNASEKVLDLGIVIIDRVDNFIMNSNENAQIQILSDHPYFVSRCQMTRQIIKRRGPRGWKTLSNQ